MRARRLFVLLLLPVAVVAIYGQVGGHGFVDWDDDLYVSANARVRGGLSADGAAWAFSTTEVSNWHPLTWLSHMADVSLFGLSAGWHHRVSVLFHMANAILLFLLLESLTGSVWRSGLVAALFAVHPLHVESVAWLSERKDLLSTLFWLLSTLSYVGYARRGGAWRYASAGLFFALGLMSKPMLVTLPLTLLLLDWWPLGRLQAAPGESSRRRLGGLVVEKLPLLALSAASAATTYFVQAAGGGMATWERSGPGLRLANAVVSYAAYLGKTVWPSSLSVLYPFPPAASGIPAWRVVAALLFLAALSFAAARWARSRPWLATGWLWYVGTLVPVIGLVQVGPQAMADRYTYVPLVGIFVAAAWEGSWWRSRLRIPRWAALSAVAATVALLGASSWVQAGYWRDTGTLFRRALAVTEDNFIAHNNLGLALAAQGRFDEAIAHYRDALRIRPDMAQAWSNMGIALAARGRVDEAVASFGEAVRLDPGKAPSRNNLGMMLAARGDVDGAIAQYREAIRLKPDGAEPRNNLGLALAARGRADEAIGEYREAIRLRPDYAEAYGNLGIALAGRGRADEALASFREAVRLDPGKAPSRGNLAVALAARGDLEGAIAQYRELLRLRPDSADAHARLGAVLARAGRREEAAAHFREALRLDPARADAGAALRGGPAGGRVP